MTKTILKELRSHAPFTAKGRVERLTGAVPKTQLYSLLEKHLENTVSGP